jgi:hypothetical protein
VTIIARHALALNIAENFENAAGTRVIISYVCQRRQGILWEIHRLVAAVRNMRPGAVMGSRYGSRLQSFLALNM